MWIKIRKNFLVNKKINKYDAINHENSIFVLLHLILKYNDFYQYFKNKKNKSSL